MITETAKVGKRGTIVIPAALRRKYGFEEGSQIVVEPVPEGSFLDLLLFETSLMFAFPCQDFLIGCQ